MPKMKTNSSAKKRFRSRKNDVKVRQANRSHINSKVKSSVKRKRRPMMSVVKSSVKQIQSMLRGG